ncbi:MAG: UvrD-helicase domain-containing protein [Holophagae bacterium]|nr:UvrD-helicase domain-containing protein [Holophagae bacterium]
MDRIGSLLSRLDEDQRRAVTHGEGPLLVVAGAGSGKTRVLTYRIAWLLAAGRVRSHQIMAVTFTNKAAHEMRERVEALLGQPLCGGFVGTFHRFALQLLRRHPREAGLPERFSIADEDEQRKLLESVYKRLSLSTERLPVRQARSRISAAKNALQAPGAWPGIPLLADLYAAYEEALRAAGAVDFDDMLLLSVRLLEQHEDIRKALASRFSWMLVDEYQDTNAAQAQLLWLLGGRHPNLTAVGDEDQSIYRWRGADVANILDFRHTYPDASEVILGRNYRSVEPILAAAAGGIGCNRRRRAKHLTSHAGPGDLVIVFQAADEIDEARFVAEGIEQARRDGAAGIAVLYRTNAQSRPFEAELVRRAVPYRVVGGARFWERAEVKDALAYLRLLANPHDALAFRRAVGVPSRGIGAVALEHVEEAALASGLSLPAAARTLPPTLTSRARLSFQGFFALLDELVLIATQATPEKVVRELLERSGLAAQYVSSDEEDRVRRDNQDQLVAAAAEAAERGLDLSGFLDEVALLTDADARVSPDAVQLSTLHAAKGLEFDTVFLVGMDDGLLPLRREGSDADDEEEERRLAYVGMTRARRRLHLTCARQRRVNGQLLGGRPSPFLFEVPPEALDDRSSPLRRSPDAEPASSRRRAYRGRSEPRSPLPSPLSSGREGDSRSSQPGPPRPGSASAWRPGLKVRHPTFGTGVVLQVQGGGAQTRLVVYFDRFGRKTLIPALANLQPV